MNKNVLIGSAVIVAIVGGFIFFISQKPQTNTSFNTPQAQTKNTDEGKIVEGYNGKVLAGNKTPYIIFNKADYGQAKKDGKIIFLDFYANWCPICRAEAPELITGFNELKRNDIVGFRVNFNDTETDEDEKTLAKEFEIPYQHTKVILQNGNVVLKDGDSWDKTKFLEEINKL